jgi:6-phosphogluconolactonase
MRQRISAFTIDAVTGVLTTISGSPFARPGNPHSLQVHPPGKFLSVSNNGAGTIATYAIDPLTVH